MVVSNQIEVRRLERVQEIVLGLVTVHLREDERDLRFRRQGLDGLERLVRDPDGAAVRVVGGEVKGVLQIEEHKDATRGGEGLAERLDLTRIRLDAFAKRNRIRFFVRIEKSQAVDFAGIVENLKAPRPLAVLLDPPGHLADIRGLPRKSVPVEVLGGDGREVVGPPVDGTQIPTLATVLRECLHERHCERGLAGALDSQEQCLCHADTRP